MAEYGVVLYGRPDNYTSIFGSQGQFAYNGIPHTRNDFTSVYIGASTGMKHYYLPTDQWNTYILKVLGASNASVTLNGDISNFSYTGSLPKTYSIYLFGNNVRGSVLEFFSGRIKSFYIKDNNVLVRDMIPVKDSDGVACMYDLVTKQFFYNAGTGNFIAGPDL